LTWLEGVLVVPGCQMYIPDNDRRRTTQVLWMQRGTTFGCRPYVVAH
jgi:hypothetical protein